MGLYLGKTSVPSSGRDPCHELLWSIAEEASLLLEEAILEAGMVVSVGHRPNSHRRQDKCKREAACEVLLFIPSRQR